MDRDLSRELTTLMPEDLDLAAPKKKKDVARRFCGRCASIDLQKAFMAEYSFIKGTELGPQSTWRPDECDLCEFFSRILLIVPQDRFGTLPIPSSGLPSTEITERVRLSAPDSSSVISQGSNNSIPVGISKLAFEHHCKQKYALGTHSGGDLKGPAILVRSNRDLSSQMEVTTPMVDFNLIKGWLQKISVQNYDNRGPEVAHDASSHGLGASNDMSLHVIDRFIQSLVRLPTHTQAQYVTLSYVWGPLSGPHVNDVIFSNLPPTIKDSIAVCQKLGYKYLWVDRYCIPQDDVEERHRQIQQMGTIYRNSALTIVACAGSDPQYGLPGVSKSRTPHSSILIKDVGHIQQIPVTADIRRSVWAKRGWTYQEALLSQAKLYFTDQQVYYEDEDSVRCEVNDLAGAEVPDDCQVWDTWIYCQEAWFTAPMDVYECIHQFSTRILSFPSDAIDALQGIFAKFEQVFQIGHVCGMAFRMTHPEEDAVPCRDPRRQGFTSDIPTLQSSLLFETDLESTRCDAFPSWSWAGWTGEKVWPISYYCHRWALDPNLAFVVAVEVAPNRTISWREFQTYYDTLRIQSVRSIKFIHIQAYLVPPILGYTQTDNIHDNHVVGRSIDLKDGMRVYTTMKHTTDIKDIEECALIRFFCPSPLYYESNATHLLVRGRRTYWERVAYVEGFYVSRNGNRIPPKYWPGVLRTFRMG